MSNIIEATNLRIICSCCGSQDFQAGYKIGTAERNRLNKAGLIHHSGHIVCEACLNKNKPQIKKILSDNPSLKSTLRAYL